MKKRLSTRVSRHATPTPRIANKPAPHVSQRGLDIQSFAGLPGKQERHSFKHIKPRQATIDTKTPPLIAFRPAEHPICDS